MGCKKLLTLTSISQDDLSLLKVRSEQVAGSALKIPLARCRPTEKNGISPCDHIKNFRFEIFKNPVLRSFRVITSRQKLVSQKIPSYPKISVTH